MNIRLVGEANDYVGKVSFYSLLSLDLMILFIAKYNQVEQYEVINASLLAPQ